MPAECIPISKKTSNSSFNPIKRNTWENCVCNQIVESLNYFRPETLQELLEILRKAKQENCKVKAIGSGHSFSDILQTTDFLINCHGLNNPIELDKNLLKDDEELRKQGYSTKHLVHVENGIRIKDLNKYLQSKKLALLNMGAFDAQTIVGVISTSTHGSGITLGPIASSVASIVLVGDDGMIYRIEPEKGITDPVKYKARFPDNKLIQSDDWFNSVLVSMGCMGIFYSVILKVTDSYYLKEERANKEGERYWEELKQGDKIAKLLNENRHLEIWINPYQIDGKHNCLVTKRNIYIHKKSEKLTSGNTARHKVTEWLILVFKRLPSIMFRLFYKKTPQLLKWSMNSIIDYDGYIDKSYEVLNLGNANYIKGYSGEYAVSLENNLFIEAADKIIELAEKNKEIGEIYHTAPISLRFVKECSGYLSMMNGENKCLIEIPLLVKTQGRFQILDKIEHELFKLGKIRPHWGHYHNLSEETIKQLYPNLNKWLGIYKQLNKNGTFNNTFTDRCGFR